MYKSITKLASGYGMQLSLMLALLGLDSKCEAQEALAGPVSTEVQNHADVLRLISIPTEALPDHVRLMAQIRTAPIVPVTRNPHVVVDPERISRVAAFFGMREKSDLALVQAAVVAIYQEETSANEIGIYGLFFSDKRAAGKWFNKLTQGQNDSPFLLKGGLLVYVWKDDGASRSSFDAIRNYLKTTHETRKCSEQHF